MPPRHANMRQTVAEQGAYHFRTYRFCLYAWFAAAFRVCWLNSRVHTITLFYRLLTFRFLPATRTGAMPIGRNMSSHHITTLFPYAAADVNDFAAPYNHAPPNYLCGSLACVADVPYAKYRTRQPFALHYHTFHWPV